MEKDTLHIYVASFIGNQGTPSVLHKGGYAALLVYGEHRKMVSGSRYGIPPTDLLIDALTLALTGLKKTNNTIHIHTRNAEFLSQLRHPGKLSAETRRRWETARKIMYLNRVSADLLFDDFRDKLYSETRKQAEEQMHNCRNYTGKTTRKEKTLF